MRAQPFDASGWIARRGLTGRAAAGLLSLAVVGAAGAQEENVASAGNGGVATAEANGGDVVIGDIASGGNSGNVISVGDTVAGGPDGWFYHPVSGWCYCFIVGDASVVIDGGDVANSTTISVSADGGVAAAKASRGDNNVAVVDDFGA